MLFNNPDDSQSGDIRPYNVLVASDAIGMGLNLSIRRIIFSTLTKFDGKEFRSLNSSVGTLTISCPDNTKEVKQIAGRAGRYGSQYERGEVTVLHSHDHQFLSQNLYSSDDQLTKAYLFPTREQLELLGAFIDTKATSEDLLDYWKDIFQTLYGPSDGLIHFSAVVSANAIMYSTAFVLKYFESIQIFAMDLEIFLEERRQGITSGRERSDSHHLGGQRNYSEIDRQGPRVPLHVLFSVFKACAIQGKYQPPIHHLHPFPQRRRACIALLI